MGHGYGTGRWDPVPPAAVGHPPTAVDYPPTAVSCPPTAFGYPPPAVSYSPPAVCHPPTTVAYPPTAVSYPPTAVSYPPSAVDYQAPRVSKKILLRCGMLRQAAACFKPLVGVGVTGRECMGTEIRALLLPRAPTTTCKHSTQCKQLKALRFGPPSLPASTFSQSCSYT